MARIINVVEDVVDGKEGFIINWEFVGLSKASARFRAVGMTALRFPTTVTEAKVVDIERQVVEPGVPNFRVSVFIPTEGIIAAGIGNPIAWMRDQFEEQFRER